MNTTRQNTSTRVLLSLALIAIVALSWSGILEQSADHNLQPTLQRALVAAAVARGLNGVISVAQGTEIAISPVGVGVTIAAGEILDPLNDLVERFSWLALAASASLGAQLLLTEIFAEPAVNMALTGAVVVYLLVLWWPRELPGLAWLLRVAAFLIFIRFLFTMVSLSVGLVDHWVLQERAQAALAELTMASEQIETLDETSPPALDSERSILERFESVLDSSRQALDIETQISSLQTSVESSISQLMDLIVVFVVQTLMLPLLAIYIAVGSFKWFWRWSLTGRTSNDN